MTLAPRPPASPAHGSAPKPLHRSERTCRSNRTCQKVVAGGNLDRVRSKAAWAKLYGFFQRDRGARRGRGEAPGDEAERPIRPVDPVSWSGRPTTIVQ